MIVQKTETKEKEVATHLFLMSLDWSTAIIASKSVNNFIQPPIKASKTYLPQTLTPTPLLYNVMITVKNHISWCLVSTSIAVNVIRNIGLVRRPTEKNLLLMTLITQFEMLICPSFHFNDFLRRHQMIFNHYKALWKRKLSLHIG